jgi:putative endonuclease
MSDNFFWLYVLKCVDKSYYVGHTDALEVRLAQHVNGAIANCYTATRRPVTLVYSVAFDSREEALAAERQIKGWSRKKKEAMMLGNWQLVSSLAKSNR